VRSSENVPDHDFRRQRRETIGCTMHGLTDLARLAGWPA